MPLLAGILAILSPAPASAAGTQLFDQPFHHNTADGDGAVVLPKLPAGGANFACLSAAGNAGPAPLHSCGTAPDVQGSGTLRLTDTSGSKTGGLFAATSVPTSQGLDVTFNAYQYGTVGVAPADGLAFALSAVDPANPRSPATIGPSGGSLGYTAFGSGTGLAYGYMGFGFDVYGNYSGKLFEGSGCTDPAYIAPTGRIPGQVVVRGPGNGLVGYCGINSTATTPTSPVVPLRATTRSASMVPVEVVVNPTAATVTTSSGLVVPASTYQLVFTPVGGVKRTLQAALPTVPSGLYPSTWVNANGIPKQLAFGWVASTGANVDFHEIDTARIVSLGPVPELTVSQTAYAQPTLARGDPVSYTVVSGVDVGTAETAAILVTDTLPAGVVPDGGSGTGWICQPPSGQQITCTNSNGPFLALSTLPTLTITGTVTSASVTPAIIQSNTVVTASSTDSNPAYSSAAAAGTPPAAPSGVTVAPASGPTGTATVVSGTNVSAATAVEIGTSAELAAATGTTLTLCPGGIAAAGCFTGDGSGNLHISSMPAHVVGAVLVRVVTLGAAGTGAYSYLSAPGTPTASAVAGVASATVTWSAPSAGGSTITGYIVTPTKDGVVQTAILYGRVASATLTGLTVKSTYTFTVAAVNAIGTGSPSAPTDPVVPYDTPAAPTIGTASAGSSAAIVRWTAPVDDGGSAVTAYVVTPHIGGVAQAAQTFFSAATTQVVTGLTPGTTYTFRVRAKNAAGDGPSSAHSNSVTINAAPALAFPAPPVGELGVAYSVQLTVSDGTGPFAWAVPTGALPPGLTLGAGTGLLSGTPTAAGSYPFTVMVTDSFNQTATEAVTLVVQKLGASLQLTSSAASSRIGTAITLTGTIAPADATGTVSFADRVVSGPQAGSTVTLSTVTVSGGSSSFEGALPAFGANTIVATYSGDATHMGATSSTVVEVVAYTGEIIITEFRSSGPSGTADQYVELYNTGPPAPLAGFAIAATSGATTVLPTSAPTLGTGRSYLVTGAAFSLGAFATADVTVANLGSGGLHVVAPDTAGTSTDGVGPSSGFHLGTPLPAMTGNPSDQYAWVRLHLAGLPTNTGSNAANFALVSSSGGLVGGVQSMLGSPSPTGLANPHENTSVKSYLIDPTKALAASPNRVYTVGSAGSAGRLVIMRTITNTSPATITAAKVRITAISEAHGVALSGGSPSSVAWLRAVNPATPTSQIPVTNRGTVTVHNLAVDAPIVDALGGGLNTTLTIPLPPGGLVAGASVDVAFTFDVDTHGAFWLSYDIDAT